MKIYFSLLALVAILLMYACGSNEKKIATEQTATTSPASAPEQSQPLNGLKHSLN
jgi:ABC-type enterochelin transport system substrate-binding protein